MRQIIFFLLSCLFLSCEMTKVTEFKIKNENDFPIAVTVKANNCEQTFEHIKPHSQHTGQFDWTQLNDKDGQWIFFIQNENSGGIDSFSHGYFTHGELYSFADLISKGNELKVEISE